MGQGWRLFFSEALPSLSLQQRIEGLSMDEVKSPTGNLFPSTKARKLLVFGCMNSIEPIERIPIGTLANGSLSLRRFVEKCGEKQTMDFGGRLHYTCICFWRKRRYVHNVHM